MNKSELIEALATRTNTSKKAAKENVEALIEVISETLSKKEEVALTGFLTLKTVAKAATTARIPGTDKIVDVPAKTVVKAVIGKNLKTLVAGK